MTSPDSRLVLHGHAGREEQAVVGGDGGEAVALQLGRASLQSSLAAVARVYQVHVCNWTTLNSQSSACYWYTKINQYTKIDLFYRTHLHSLEDTFSLRDLILAQGRLASKSICFILPSTEILF